jgi:hypothetical protein
MKLLSFFLVLLSTKVMAWGPTGHRAVGEVADKYLTPVAAYKIHKILNGQSLSKVSTWSDEIRSEPQTYSYTYNWHYTDWKEEDHQHDETNSSGKLLSAINEQINILKDVNSPQDKKAFALKFIVHLVGDLHQPLHVGNGLDQGGNKCKVTFHKKEMNLHALWDEGMIDFTNLSFTELADYVSQGRSLEEIKAWREGTVVDWALESKILRASVYPEQVRPSEGPLTIKQYCRSDIVIDAQDIPKLGYEYSYKFIPVVSKRIFQAGLRLAKMLNEAF